MVSFLWSHRIPLLVPALIPPNVVQFGEDDDYDVPGNKTEDDLVSGSIKRGICSSVDLKCLSALTARIHCRMTYVGRDNVARLYAHIVQGATDRSRPNRAGISRRNSN